MSFAVLQLAKCQTKIYRRTLFFTVFIWKEKRLSRNKTKKVCLFKARLYCGMERSVILRSNFVTTMCGNNAEAALDKCIYMQLFIKHSTHLNNERTVNLKSSSWIYKSIKYFSKLFCRTGKRTQWGLIMDGWNSLIRYYKNNFSDGFRQVS